MILYYKSQFPIEKLKKILKTQENKNRKKTFFFSL